MRRRNAPRAGGRSEQRLRQTGEHCPTSGWWTTPGAERPRFIAEGDLMPTFNGLPVPWAIQPNPAAQIMEVETDVCPNPL
ncbi:hypothetical protein GCM10012320_35960 [Sinomonas cellulolyticus]|uniref:Uncharacterized protein n=1 Tax=Sinomonas cellulolyticus TaxID=2801916 RepID=A0ABS1K4G3_9MICC|nr:MULTISPECIES: hypothetical protein [Sinomonas]MBL0706262.1 hypothetical protein [Sinomonas cellulolyticus]GHG61120.1 hypothetical protein GCM10012320_35960 [Sinomonas sp. KCTC 49339]